MIFTPTDKAYPADIPQLTSLRFFAAMAVVVHHFTMLLPFNVADYSHFPDKGALAVDFFFILSGFILTHVYLAAQEKGSFTAGAFYMKRLARIYPLHLFTLFVSIAGALGAWLFFKDTLPTYFTPTTIISNLFMTHAWGTETELGFNKPSWSISAEWFVYLFFPLLLVRLPRVRPVLLLVLAAVLFALLWLATARFWTRPVTEVTFDLGILRIVPEFIAGIALYLCGQRYRLRFCGWGAFWVMTGMIVMFAHLGMPDYLIVPLLAVLVFIAAEQARQGKRGWLAGRTAVYLGEISYSIYMVHFLLMNGIFLFGVVKLYGAVVPAGVFYALWYGLFVLTVAISALTYHFIEKPGRHWVRGLARARKQD